jgi:hypothetical protein
LNKSKNVRLEVTFAALAIGNPNPSLEEEKAGPSRPPPQEKAGPSRPPPQEKAGPSWPPRQEEAGPSQQPPPPPLHIEAELGKGGSYLVIIISQVQGFEWDYPTAILL